EGNQGVQLLADDVLLLCSDGLTDLVWDDEILEVVRSKPTLKEASRSLVELANSRGGHDNTTVVLISVPSDFKLTVKNDAGWLPWVIGGLAGVMLILVVGSVLTLGLLSRNSNVTSTSTSTLRPLFTQTPLLQPTNTLVLPAATVTPQLILPIAPTYTPWPTNTLTP
ncbi:MAG: hypothetical protein ABIQ77_09210, partial [Anaerolineales bacterium]